MAATAFACLAGPALAADQARPQPMTPTPSASPALQAPPPDVSPALEGRAATDHRGVALPLPDYGVAAPAPAPQKSFDGRLLSGPGAEVGVKAGETPGAYAEIGRGPLKTKAELGKPIASPFDPAQGSLGASLSDSLSPGVDLQVGARSVFEVADPLTAPNTALGPVRNSLDLGAGVTVTEGLSVDARTEMGLDPLLREPALRDGESSVNSTLMMRYNLGW
ncbi:MAG: hypothetical protein RIB45_03210 [Marivibrio sp.]|uniref:hypothetical protein n=1 Tax=Marivibrio sp. TaxID=2039719 RepID=UPI0032EE80A0